MVFKKERRERKGWGICGRILDFLCKVVAKRRHLKEALYTLEKNPLKIFGNIICKRNSPCVNCDVTKDFSFILNVGKSVCNN